MPRVSDRISMQPDHEHNVTYEIPKGSTMPRRMKVTKDQRTASLNNPCPYCKANTGQPCTRPRGDKNRPHTLRLRA